MKFADQDSYVLSALIATARNNQSDLNVVIQEQDYLHATAVTQQQQGLTGTVANPVPNVTTVAQVTVGNSESPLPPARPCFLAHTPVTYWDEDTLAQMPIGNLAVLQNRPYALAFNEKNEKVKGEILNVHCKVRFDYLYVTFEGHQGTCVAPEHRYWTPSGYVEIQYLHRKYVYDINNQPVKVVNIDRAEVRQGIAVYNLAIGEYENYVANGHRVHNNKQVLPD